MLRVSNILFIVLTSLICQSCEQKSDAVPVAFIPSEPFVMVTGIAQDAGYPQANCEKDCCTRAWADPSLRRMVSSIAVVDPPSEKFWMIDATPDFKDQLQLIKDRLGATYKLEGVFLTHAHIGHYTGLMHLGREVMGANQVPVYAMPRMSSFLKTSGPWSQLVSLDNIQLRALNADSTIVLNATLSITPFGVPHRDEYSETVGFSINGGTKSLMFIPDIDKWHKWNRDIISQVDMHDYALLDASFYADGEIPGRDLSEIPHPFVEETIETFAQASPSTIAKIHFIHINHTNPLLDPSSAAYKHTEALGYHICDEGDIMAL